MIEAWCDNADSVGGRNLNVIVPLLCFCPCEFNIGGLVYCGFFFGGGGGCLFQLSLRWEKISCSNPKGGGDYCLVSEMKKIVC